MSQKLNKNAFVLAVGATALAGSIATATANPFEMNQLNSGYQGVVQGEMGAKGPAEGKCGEGKCGAGMEKKGAAEGKCGAGKPKGGKCSIETMDADKDGKVSKEEFMKSHEEKFAAKDTNKDGFIDDTEMKKAKEGRCGGKGKEVSCCADNKK